ncbi:MAG: Dihydrolipoyl dehydrogenase, partial [Deltaproteobacteria bacterium]|nr:Dihydrolipoyl dehydrogenase [Deltaproteobacteria bacterium]
MAAYDFDLGILGGGAAGLTAAAGAAQFGAKTILVEKAKKLGGDCLHFGCVPSKTLIRTAGVWSLARRAKEFGLPEIALSPVSLAAVMARVRSVIDTIQEHDSPERFCRLGAAVRFGEPRFVDDHTVSVD